MIDRKWALYVNDRLYQRFLTRKKAERFGQENYAGKSCVVKVINAVETLLKAEESKICVYDRFPN